VRERRAELAALHQHHAEAEPERLLVWKRREPVAEHALCAGQIARLGERHTEGVVGVAARGLEGERPSQRVHGARGLAPAQAARAEHTQWLGARRGARAGLHVGRVGGVVVVAELVGVAQQDQRLGVARRQRGGGAEGDDRCVRVARGEVRLAAGELDTDVAGLGRGGAIQVTRRPCEIPRVEGAEAGSRLAGHAAREAKEQAERRRALTEPPNARTIPAMQRDVLQKILQTATGLVEKGGAFMVPSEHRVTVYVGREGRGVVVSEVEELRLHDVFVQVIGRDAGEVYAEYSEVTAVSVKAPKGDAKARAGFV
jgi:hypothetical protein